jgi:exopolysaccharide production protein ExoY
MGAQRHLGAHVSQNVYRVAIESPTIELEREVVPFTTIRLISSTLPIPIVTLESWTYRYFKRSIDILGSGILLILFAAPGLLIALAVLLTSKGPAFYRENRIGRNGRIFRIWKFRSMYADAAHRAHVIDSKTGAKTIEWRMRKNGFDPRITPIGRFIRKWSLDELPQLINVLRGEMSLIGPRPIVKSEAIFYGDLFKYYLEAVPGLSGLWQVSGRSRVEYKERAELDAAYVQNWSLKMDAVIFCRTFSAVLGRAGAH